MEDLDSKYKCKTHGVQSAIPCFRVNTLLGDEVSDVGIIVMGNQAEQLFGLNLKALRSKRVYVTEQIIPPEISAVIGQVHVFEVKRNTYGEWVAIAVGPREHDISMTPSTTDAGTSSSTIIPEMALQTPEKTYLEPKRTAKDIPRTLFPEAKKTRRETEEISESSSTMEEKDKLD